MSLWIHAYILCENLLSRCLNQGRWVYGKMVGRMTTLPHPVAPAPPNLFASLRAGFDAVANHLAVILLPVLLDLWLWLGPHVRIKTLLSDFQTYLVSSPNWDAIQSGAILETYQVMLEEAALRLNLMMSLRSFPIGVPSLMAARLPIEVPGGAPLFWEISNGWVVIGLVFALFLIGLGIGSLYFSLVAQAAIGGKVEWRKTLRNWPWAMLQVLSLTLALLIVLLVISLPTSCALSVISWGGISLGQVGILLFIGIMMWMAFPLVFTPHGIFADHNNVLYALRRSIRVTRLTLPTTALLFLAILVISEGLDILWRVPAENSWLTLLGMGGHAFVTTGLLAATYVYYRDADRWVQKMTEQMARSAASHNPPA